MRHNTPKVTSVEKALGVLMEFSRSGREIGTGELSRSLGFHAATVSRMLRILLSKGFVQQNEKTKKFRLGPSALELGRTVFRLLQGNLLPIAVPYLIDLCEEVGETVVFETMLKSDEIVAAYIAQGSHSLAVVPKAGYKIPVHASPGAKSILAFSEPNIVDAFLDGDLQAYTPHTITDKEVLKKQLEEIKKQGFAFGWEEFSLNVHSIGAPVFDHDNKAVAAVVIVGLASRIALEANCPFLVPLLKTTRNISARLFHRH